MPPPTRISQKQTIPPQNPIDPPPNPIDPPQTPHHPQRSVIIPLCLRVNGVESLSFLRVIVPIWVLNPFLLCE